MNWLELFLRGIAAGLAISIPVGPVNVLCISQTLRKGKQAGLISGLGAAAADTIYGAIAGFSISFVIDFLIREVFWIRLFGGILLIGIGIYYYFKKAGSVRQASDSTHSDFVAALLLNLTNPTTVLSFLAVLAALHTADSRPWWLTVFLVAGIFCGAMIWWIAVALLADHFRDRFDEHATRWMNRIAGIAIGLFGVLTLLLSRRHAP
jgi:threonine/homoserine/homoserine lactone efflux protein